MIEILVYIVFICILIFFMPVWGELFLVFLAFCIFIGAIKAIAKISKKHLHKNKYADVDFDSMSGIEFEHFFANILKDNGYSNVRTTKKSGDHGIDILAQKNGCNYAIQCKCYSGKVGNKAVQEVYAGKTIYNADVGSVLTNSYFTKQAIEEASVLGIELWDRKTLLDFIKTANKDPITIEKETNKKNCNDNNQLREIESFAIECNLYLEQKDRLEAYAEKMSDEKALDYAREMKHKIIHVFTSFGIRVIIENFEIDDNSICFFLKPNEGVRVKAILSFKRDIELAIGNTIQMEMAPKKGCVKIMCPR